MSPVNATPRIPLSIHAGDAGTEIFLVDSHFAVIASGVGVLDTKVVPGLYKVRYRAGGTIRDELIQIQPTHAMTGVRITGTPIDFASPVPLPDTKTPTDAYEVAWQESQREPAQRIGQGARLFLLLRDPGDSPRGASTHYPWNGVVLTDQHGKLLWDLQATPQNRMASIESFNAELDPGTYLLCVDTVLYGRQEMAFTLCEGWQTQVVLASRSWLRWMRGKPRWVRRIDLSDAAIFMFPCGIVPGIAAPQLRLAELARQAFIQGRPTVAPAVLQAMLHEKFFDPMLGIFAAHILLQEAEPNRPLLNEVIDNLVRLIPGHPDVMALRCLCDPTETLPLVLLEFSTPPLLLASWRTIAEHSIDQPGLVPQGSLAERIAFLQPGGGPWLTWRRSRQRWSTPRQPRLPPNDPVAALTKLLTKVRQCFPMQMLVETDVQLAGFDLLQRAVIQESAARPSLDAVALRGIARNLCLPAACLAEVATSVLMSDTAQKHERDLDFHAKE
jgi:hypothetical protein